MWNFGQARSTEHNTQLSENIKSAVRTAMKFDEIEDEEKRHEAEVLLKEKLDSRFDNDKRTTRLTAEQRMRYNEAARQKKRMSDVSDL